MFISAVHSCTGEYVEEFTESTRKEIIVNDEENGCRFED